ncbi:MAG: BlaI/MecI/CopY family transcriptional regulator [Oscillospiraceae bacterium]|nr:BlaI/MecI/CopY family transcriptional regulator [Oscillospiraceae bacterium]
MNISDSELKLMEIIWLNEPVKSGELVKLAFDGLGWKKSTVYTVVKKLTEKGVIKNESTVVSSLRGRDDVLGEKSERVIKKGYGGSLPVFLTSFLSREKLTKEQAEELKRLIDDAVDN